jgi:hypothetical protein
MAVACKLLAISGCEEEALLVRRENRPHDIVLCLWCAHSCLKDASTVSWFVIIINAMSKLVIPWPHSTLAGVLQYW